MYKSWIVNRFLRFAFGACMGAGMLAAEAAAQGPCPPPPPPDDNLGPGWALMLYGQAVTPEPNGGFKFSNVAAPDVFGAGGPGTFPDGMSDDYYRLTGVRVDAGATRYVYSTSPFRITANGTESVMHSELTFTDTPPPLPDSIDLAIADPVIVINATTTLTTTANLTQGSPIDVTPAESWTVYRSSNVNIASIVQVGTGPTAVVEVRGQSAGTAFITARNGGATSVRRVIVDYPGNLIPTTVEGYVRLSNGQPVAGAGVSVDDYGDSGISQTPDGRFSFVLDPVPAGAVITVRAATASQAGSATGISVVPGGITDAGIITLETVCDSPWFKGFGSTVFLDVDPDPSGDFSSDLVWMNDLEIFDDDGAGPNPPALFIAGEFDIAGGRTINNIAKWVNGAWAPLVDFDTGIDGTRGEITELEVLDLNDGNGPALFAVGYFILAGGKPANKVAKWDGVRWHVITSGGAAGGGVGDAHAFAWSLAAHDDGTGNGTALYVGGNFRTAGEFVAGAPDECISPNCVDADRIARWDPDVRVWEPVGGGFNANALWGDVHALVAFDADGVAGPQPAYLYAGGDFYEVTGNNNVNDLVRWDGTAWAEFGGGMNGAVVKTFMIFNDGGGPALYVGGNISGPDGTITDGIAKWNGAAWTPVGSGLWGEVVSMVGWMDGVVPRIFASGVSLVLPPGGGTPNLRSIAHWNGTQWTTMDQGLDSQAHDMIMWDHGAGPMLHVTGKTSSGGSGLVAGELKPGTDPRSVNTVRARGGPAPAGGVISATEGWIATWKNNEWGVLSNGLNNEVHQLTLLDPDGPGAAGESMHAVGMFTPPKGPRDENAPPFPTAAVARFDGTRWRSVGNGFTFNPTTITADARALVAFDDDATGPNPTRLFAGGSFNRTKNAAGSTVTLLNVARWMETEWAPAGPVSGAGSLSGTINALTVFDPDGAGPGIPALFAGGTFTNRIARWVPGASPTWSNTPAGVTGVINAMAVFNSELYVGGSFTNLNSIGAADYLAKWNGATWSAVVTGLNAQVHAITVFDDDGPGPIQPALYVGGEFTQSGPQTATRVGRWNGTAFAAVGTGTPLGGASTRVYALAGLENVDGRFLYAGGDFTTGPTTGLLRIAKWNPVLATWSDVAGGVDGETNVSVRALAGYDDGMVGPTLFVGGHFDAAAGALTAGGVTAGNVARFGCTGTAPKVRHATASPESVVLVK